MQKRRRALDPQEAAYLELLLSDRNPDNKKLGLQRLCKHYRANFAVANADRFLAQLQYLLEDADPKVVRWALNAMALLGTQRHLPAVKRTTGHYLLDEDIAAAGFSAITAIGGSDALRAFLDEFHLPLEGATLLAAAQQSPSLAGELATRRIDLGVAGPVELRLASILIGVGKAPEHMFSAKHLNADVIGDLNTHPDPIVAQYSVWATYENPSLGVNNLRVQNKDIATFPPNVRKYLYRLLASNNDVAARNFDALVIGSEDDDEAAREGLAIGIKNIFVDGLDTLTHEWLRDEESEVVRQRLIEHMAAQSLRSERYRKPVLQNYLLHTRGSLGRARIEAAARKTPLARDLMEIAHQTDTGDLFDGFAGSPYRLIHAPPPQKLLEDKMNDRLKSVEAIKTLIVTALPKELTAVFATVEDEGVVGKDGDSNIYTIGRYVSANGEIRRVLIVSSGMGKSSASAVGIEALRSFPNIQHILMVGIAGGCPNIMKPEEHIRLGDIVHSSGGIIEYDNIKRLVDEDQIRSTIQKPAARASRASALLAAGEPSGKRPWLDHLAQITKMLPGYARPAPETDILRADGVPVVHPADPARRNGEPRIFGGVIGAADILLKNPAQRDALRDKFGVRAVEMEASGLRTAAWLQQKDIYVVRGVCDYCDPNKDDVWQNYAAAAAAAYARSLIEQMPIEWFE